MSEILNRLSDIDIDDRLPRIKNRIEHETSPRIIDKLVKEFKVLNNLKKEGLTPYEAFTREIVPVIPAQFRSPIELPNGNIFSPETNILLRDIALTNNLVDKSKEMGKEQEDKATKELYKTVEKLMGFKSPEEGKNLFDTISGGKAPPKRGFFQRHMVRKRQNMSGGSVISPGPHLDIDEVEIPYDIGLNIFEPFIKKELTERGYANDDIEKAISKRTSLAKDALLSASRNRPVLINRAPSIWQGSVTAHKPIFTNKKNITIPSLLTAYQGADFDGDSCISFIRLRYKQNADFYIDIKSVFKYIVSIIKIWRKKINANSNNRQQAKHNSKR